MNMNWRGNEEMMCLTCVARPWDRCRARAKQGGVRFRSSCSQTKRFADAWTKRKKILLRKNGD